MKHCLAYTVWLIDAYQPPMPTAPTSFDDLPLGRSVHLSVPVDDDVVLFYLIFFYNGFYTFKMMSHDLVTAKLLDSQNVLTKSGHLSHRISYHHSIKYYILISLTICVHIFEAFNVFIYMFMWENGHTHTFCLQCSFYDSFGACSPLYLFVCCYLKYPRTEIKIYSHPHWTLLLATLYLV